jgi:hypothetical protein
MGTNRVYLRVGAVAAALGFPQSNLRKRTKALLPRLMLVLVTLVVLGCQDTIVEPDVAVSFAKGGIPGKPGGDAPPTRTQILARTGECGCSSVTQQTHPRKPFPVPAVASFQSVQP